MAFRLSSAAVEIRSGKVKDIAWWEYGSFAFFVPTALVGPINPLSNYLNSFQNNKFKFSDYINFLIRIIFGITKIFFLGTLFQKMSFEVLLFDGFPHYTIDLFISGVFFYFYLYVNFSGFCDIAIGTSGLMGIKVAENFDNPLVARNLKTFWNRWHLTLSRFIRDTLFNPLNLKMTRLFGPKHLNHIIAFSILIVFVFIGIWHGTSWNFLLFGLAHAVGMIIHHYYTLTLKKKLNFKQFKIYNESILVRVFATITTFMYVVFTMILFANSVSDLKKILSIIN